MEQSFSFIHYERPNKSHPYKILGLSQLPPLARRHRRLRDGGEGHARAVAHRWRQEHLFSGADDGDVNASYVEIDYDNGIDQDVNVVNVDSVGSHVVGNDSVASGNDYIGSDIPEAQAVASAPVETHDSVHDYAESNISYDDGGADSFDADDIALDA